MIGDNARITVKEEDNGAWSMTAIKYRLWFWPTCKVSGTGLTKDQALQTGIDTLTAWFPAMPKEEEEEEKPAFTFEQWVTLLRLLEAEQRERENNHGRIC